MALYLKKAGTLLDSQKQTFLELVQANESTFRNFYNNQVDLFKRVCGYYLDDLSTMKLRKYFHNARRLVYLRKSGLFEPGRGQSCCLQRGTEKYAVKELWREKTRTESPRDWSKKHKMPILCLVPDSEVAKAKVAFDAVNRPKTNEQSIDRAMEYLLLQNSLTFWMMPQL